jgi:hypothetical protein
MRSRFRKTSNGAIQFAFALRIVARSHALVLDERRVVNGLAVGALARLFTVSEHSPSFLEIDRSDESVGCEMPELEFAG